MDNILEALGDFTSFIESCGGALDKAVIMDGTSRRIRACDEPKYKKSMIYRGYLDGIPNGFVMDFRSGIKHDWKFAKGRDSLTPEEKAKLDAEIKANAEKREKEEKLRALKSARMASDVIKSTVPCESHPYLTKKGVKSYGLRLATEETQRIYKRARAGSIIMPLYNPNSQPKLVSFQIIKADGTKELLANSLVKGSCFVIGELSKTKPNILAEGYATAASLHEVTGRAVIVALNASNLVAVSKEFTDYRIVVGADNDAHLPLKEMPEGRPKLKNVGVEYAKQTGLPMVVPQDKNKNISIDWNDYMMKNGASEMKNEIMRQDEGLIMGKNDYSVEVYSGDEDDAAAKIENILVDADARIFSSPEGMVFPVFDDRDIVKIETGDENLVGTLVSRFMNVYRPAKAKEGEEPKMVKCRLPSGVLKSLLGRIKGRDTHLRPLEFVTSSPTLLKGGRVLYKDGYDAPSKGYHFKDNSIKLERLPKDREQALKSLNLIKDLLSEFCFKDKLDMTVAISALLSAVARMAVGNHPLFIFAAPTAGSGKSFLVDVITLIAFGNRVAVTSAGKDDEETDKRLAAKLIERAPLISLDNVNGEIDSVLLNQIITQPRISIRPLGQSKTIEIKKASLMFATGNGITVARDMTRRTMVCTLDPGVERPEFRDFSKRPDALVEANRGKYLSAAFNILLSFIAVPNKPKISHLSSFEEWDLIRGALVWLGEDDPVISMEKSRESDPESSDLQQVIYALKSLYDETMAPLSAADIVAKLYAQPAMDTGFGGSSFSNHDEERSAFLNVAAGDGGRINSKRLGRYLTRYSGRIIDNMRIKRMPRTNTGGFRYIVEKVEEKK